MSYAGPMLDVEPQKVHHCPYNNNHTMLPPSGNRTTFDPCYLPENHGQLPYVNIRHNCEHCNAFVIPSPRAGVSSVPVNHDHFPFLNNHQIFERNRSLFMDGSNGVFKRSGSLVAVPMTSERNRATGPMGFDYDPVVVHSSSHLAHGGQLVQPVPAGGFSRNRAHGVPYLHDMRLHGYQVAGLSRNSRAFIMPRPMRPQQGPHNVYHPPPLPPPPLLQPPMLPVQAQNMDGHVHLPSTSRRRSTRTSSRHPFQNDADPGPSYVGPALPHGIMVYEARRQQLMIDSIERHRSLAFPHFRVLPEEELLALGEHIGNTDSGLSDNFISDQLKTRTFASFRRHSEDLMPADEEPNFCVICQMEFENQEKIGILDCCHEYHEKCIKKWLVVKNNCPICKSAALR
ncbi:hypothetical protein L1987_02325 [Smallanthus sonchifolius]|uniref:Uncharacterized protein n=1 Tax=Smallanthus sonchifolius TaxID=185202 RepID=A0ACB9K7I7_9ASTR|nr:hypothetical protein L1987_02325 [Smallanthus sonchifolius]